MVDKPTPRKLASVTPPRLEVNTLRVGSFSIALDYSDGIRACREVAHVLSRSFTHSAVWTSNVTPRIFRPYKTADKPTDFEVTYHARSAQLRSAPRPLVRFAGIFTTRI